MSLGKLHRLLEGEVCAFPGNASLSQYFTVGFTESRIDAESVALIHDEHRYTFMELENISDKMAEILKETLKSIRNQNPDSDSVIAICIPPSSKLIFVLFAIYKIGACYVPIDVSFPEDRVFKIVKDCKPILIISDHHANCLSKFDIVKEQAKVLSTQDLMNQVNGKMEQDSAADHSAEDDEEEGDTTDAELTQLDIQMKDNNNSKSKTTPIAPLGGHPVLAERTAIVLYTSGIAK